MTPDRPTRRELIKPAAVGALAWPFVGASARAAEKSESASAAREHGLRLGVATYSTRELSLDDTVSALTALRIRNAGVYKKHCDWESATPDQCRAVAAKFHGAGIAITGSGVINFTTDETAARRAFENVKAAGMTHLVCKPTPESLPLVEKLAKEYDQRVAIHNHGPEDKLWPSP